MFKSIINISSKTFFISAAFLASIFLFITVALAAGSVSPTTDPGHGFPDWYADNAGNKVVPCLDGSDPICVLPGAGEEPNFDPAQPTVFPSNFPSEFFYWIAESNLLNTPGGGKTFIRYAVEGAFLNDEVVVGDQMVFGRVRVTGTGLTPNSTYVVTHAYGIDSYRTNEVGVITRKEGTEDIGCEIGSCNFSEALGSRVFQSFLKWDSGAPAGYLGDAVTPHTVTGSPISRNSFKIQGPGLPAAGLSTNLFTVSGKIFAPSCTDTSPGAPTLTTPANGATGVVNNPNTNVAWTAPASFGTNCTGNNNQFEVFLDQGNVVPTTSRGIVASTQTNLAIAGLLDNTTYSWKVRALNGALSTDSSVFTFTTGGTACTNTAPDVPTLASPANGATGVATNPTVTWNNVASFGTNCTGNNNQFEVFLDQGNVNPTTSKGVVAGTSTTLDVTGLLSNTTYSWKVRAKNGALSSDSAVRTFTTLVVTPPVAPSSLIARDIGGIQLTWLDRSNNETEFVIERKQGTTGAFAQIGTVGQNIKTFTDNTAPLGTLGYRVKACNSGVCSSYSNTAFIFNR